MNGERSDEPAPRPAASRKPGRPRKQKANALTRETVIECGLRMAAMMTLDDISIVRVARELGVTPALIHYYLDGGRDALVSGVINRFYGVVLREWPEVDSDWRRGTMQLSRYVLEQFLKYPGVAAYFTQHSRFRLIQLVAPGEQDNCVAFHDRFIGHMRAVGFEVDSAGIFAYLLFEVLLACAHGTARYRWPREHVAWLKQEIGKLDAATYPNLLGSAGMVGSLDADHAFTVGMQVFVAGMADALQRQGERPARR